MDDILWFRARDDREVRFMSTAASVVGTKPAKLPPKIKGKKSDLKANVDHLLDVELKTVPDATSKTAANYMKWRIDKQKDGHDMNVFALQYEKGTAAQVILGPAFGCFPASAKLRMLRAGLRVSFDKWLGEKTHETSPQKCHLAFVPAWSMDLRGQEWEAAFPVGSEEQRLPATNTNVSTKSWQSIWKAVTKQLKEEKQRHEEKQQKSLSVVSFDRMTYSAPLEQVVLLCDFAAKGWDDPQVQIVQCEVSTEMDEEVNWEDVEEAEDEAQLRTRMVGSGETETNKKRCVRLNVSSHLSEAELEKKMPHLQRKLQQGIQELSVNDIKGQGMDESLLEKLKKELSGTFSKMQPLRFGIAAVEPKKTEDAPKLEGIEDPAGRLQEVAAQVSSLCTAKAAWARELSLSEPRDLGAELSQLLAGQRMGDVESPAIEEPQELLRKCSGGRALQGCIPTREHWQLQPPRFLMAMPRKVELKVLSWSTDLEARVESLEESSQMKVMAKKFGVSQAQSLEKSSSAGIAGFSKEEKKEQSEERHTTDESSRARRKDSRLQTSHHVRMKAIGRFLIDLPDHGDLAFSERALQRLRQLFQEWRPKADLDNRADLAGEQRRGAMLRSFFEDFGSHLNSGPVSLGGLFITEGTIMSKEELSAESSTKLFAQSMSRETSKSQKKGFDGGQVGEMISAGGAAGGGPAGLAAQGLGSLVTSISVSTAESSGTKSASQDASTSHTEGVETSQDATTTIRRSTYGGLPTDDLLQWSESLMAESEKGGRLEVIDMSPNLVGIWDIVSRSFWDFGRLSAHSVSVKQLTNFVKTLQLVFQDSFCNYFAFCTHGRFGASLAVRRDCDAVRQALELPTRKSWVLMVARVNRKGVPFDGVAATGAKECLAWVNHDYQLVQDFARFLKLEFKAIFGQASTCPACDRQFLFSEMSAHRKHCDAISNMSGVFTQTEKKLFYSYELRLHRTGVDTTMMGFCLMMDVNCALCNRAVPACEIVEHLQSCVSGKDQTDKSKWLVGSNSDGIRADPSGVLPAAKYSHEIFVDVDAFPGSDADNYLSIQGMKFQQFIPFSRKLPPYIEAMLKEGYVLRSRGGLPAPQEGDRLHAEPDPEEVLKSLNEKFARNWPESQHASHLQRSFHENLRGFGEADWGWTRMPGGGGRQVATVSFTPRPSFEKCPMRTEILEAYTKAFKTITMPLTQQKIDQARRQCMDEVRETLRTREAWQGMQLEPLGYQANLLGSWLRFGKTCSLNKQIEEALEDRWNELSQEIGAYSEEQHREEVRNKLTEKFRSNGVWFLGSFWLKQETDGEPGQAVAHSQFCNGRPVKVNSVPEILLELYFDKSKMSPAQEVCKCIHNIYSWLMTEEPALQGSRYMKELEKDLKNALADASGILTLQDLDSGSWMGHRAVDMACEMSLTAGRGSHSDRHLPLEMLVSHFGKNLALSHPIAESAVELFGLDCHLRKYLQDRVQNRLDYLQFWLRCHVQESETEQIWQVISTHLTVEPVGSACLAFMFELHEAAAEIEGFCQPLFQHVCEVMASAYAATYDHKPRKQLEFMQELLDAFHSGSVAMPEEPAAVDELEEPDEEEEEDEEDAEDPGHPVDLLWMIRVCPQPGVQQIVGEVLRHVQGGSRLQAFESQLLQASFGHSDRGQCWATLALVPDHQRKKFLFQKIRKASPALVREMLNLRYWLATPVLRNVVFASSDPGLIDEFLSLGMDSDTPPERGGATTDPELVMMVGGAGATSPFLD